jgi:heat shock protein HspQ
MWSIRHKTLSADMICSATPSAEFQTGQLVHHRRYGYRGVVVAVDSHCRASDSWYQKNQTQPSQNQPWYHVLVDESSVVTYAAQTSLEADDQAEPISHPLVTIFFSEFDGQSYVRNDEPWPGGQDGLA